MAFLSFTFDLKSGKFWVFLLARQWLKHLSVEEKISNQVGNPREVCVFSLLRFATPSRRSLSAFSYFCGVLKIIPLHREDIWTFWISVCALYMCFSFKKKQIPVLLLVFILTGLVKFLLWMESFFPSKVKLLEILLETSVWHLFYPGKHPARAVLRDLFN